VRGVVSLRAGGLFLPAVRRPLCTGSPGQLALRLLALHQDVPRYRRPNIEDVSADIESREYKDRYRDIFVFVVRFAPDQALHLMSCPFGPFFLFTGCRGQVWPLTSDT